MTVGCKELDAEKQSLFILSYKVVAAFSVQYSCLLYPCWGSARAYFSLKKYAVATHSSVLPSSQGQLLSTDHLYCPKPSLG